MHISQSLFLTVNERKLAGNRHIAVWKGDLIQFGRVSTWGDL